MNEALCTLLCTFTRLTYLILQFYPMKYFIPILQIEGTEVNECKFSLSGEAGVVLSSS